MTLKNKFENMWPSTHIGQIMDLDNNYFLVHFMKKKNVTHALTPAPWKLLGHYLHVQSGEPKFNSLTNKITLMVAWARLPGLPLHFYNGWMLWVLG